MPLRIFTVSQRKDHLGCLCWKIHLEEDSPENVFSNLLHFSSATFPKCSMISWRSETIIHLESEEKMIKCSIIYYMSHNSPRKSCPWFSGNITPSRGQKPISSGFETLQVFPPRWWTMCHWWPLLRACPLADFTQRVRRRHGPANPRIKMFAYMALFGLYI